MEHPTAPPLTTEQAAPILGVKPGTLEVWRVQGRGPAFLKIGRAVRYRAEDLDRFLAGCSRNSTAKD
ncbi:helix-turn-helix domain-containing protein [Desulfurivibrio dismutans]|uniref:helix-turn-helix domain-containing protein n=1 Tax=Desulfurivibrio dismutans TaxID=1398908 RepID=UPI003D6493DC